MKIRHLVLTAGGGAALMLGICNAEQDPARPSPNATRLERPSGDSEKPTSPAKFAPKGHHDGAAHNTGVAGVALHTAGTPGTPIPLHRPFLSGPNVETKPPLSRRVAPIGGLPRQRSLNATIGGPAVIPAKQGLDATVVNKRAVTGQRTGELSGSDIGRKY
jgi:hypothetical protein